MKCLVVIAHPLHDSLCQYLAKETIQHMKDTITPCLLGLREVKVVTTLGAPWWVDFFVMRKPVRRILKDGILGACMKKCNFQMLSLYESKKLTEAKVGAFVGKVKANL